MAHYGMNKREIADLLRGRGINPTTQRIEIAYFLFDRPQHLSADEILQQINAEYEQVSQATVYNSLRLFVDKGILRELIFSPDRIYYDSNTDPHHHFVDVDTGQIYDISLKDLSVPELTSLNGIHAEVHDVSLLVRGRIQGAAGSTDELAQQH